MKNLGSFIENVERTKEKIRNKSVDMKSSGGAHAATPIVNPKVKPADKPDKVVHKKPQMRVAKSIYRKKLLKKSLNIFGTTLGALLVVYVCFAITILRVIPTNTSLGLVAVKNATFTGGMAPKGSLVVIDKFKAQGDGLLDHAKQSVVIEKHAVLGKVMAGPYGIVKYSGGLMTVDGFPIDVSLSSKPPTTLDNQYVVKCISGDCVKGEGLIISANNIYGEPLNSNSENK